VRAETLGDAAGKGRSATEKGAEHREIDPMRNGVMKHAREDCRNGCRDGGAAGCDEAAERLWLQKRPGHEEVAAGEPTGVRNAPCIGMKHGHDGKNAVVHIQAEAPRSADTECVEIDGTVTVHHALGVSGGAGGVAHGGGGALVKIRPGEFRLFSGQQVIIAK
jgi:hypothetical protein